jgi:hypothetical protein
MGEIKKTKEGISWIRGLIAKLQRFSDQTEIWPFPSQKDFVLKTLFIFFFV